MALHCPECGFANTEGANFCARCGASLIGADPTGGAGVTAAFPISGDSFEFDALPGTDFGPGATLVIRSGGGRAGESFQLGKERLTVGRGPDSDVFLDDVTVSRDHAVIVRRGADFYLDDCGSLNGTYVNRQRIDSHRLDDGDELQVGKYKLAFLQR